jgi:uncharacterized protein DUF3309
MAPSLSHTLLPGYLLQRALNRKTTVGLHTYLGEGHHHVAAWTYPRRHPDHRAARWVQWLRGYGYGYGHGGIGILGIILIIVVVLLLSGRL